MLRTYVWWTVMGLCKLMLAVARLLALPVMLCRVYLLAWWNEFHACTRFLCFQNRVATLTVRLSTCVARGNVKGSICKANVVFTHMTEVVGSSWSLHLCWVVMLCWVCAVLCSNWVIVFLHIDTDANFKQIGSATLVINNWFIKLCLSTDVTFLQQYFI